ncbi:glucosamine-6-phosphate deaminase [Paenibacillus swuensis]|uniref:Glucosamine-6-phosphate deaminase n=1 Tax=Paenibacillus swuensis TaxID=1178515 RepID=A0A172TLW8_9BACL|nr:glucosamine-6-phosphate deaminase [Paenibacillus swuensis]ANE47807.1 glucosamine-6-phosphate deaminase [Paenibacillus swuensis]
MNILTFQSTEELNEAGAGIIVSLLQTKPDAVLGLATGGTPVGVYEQLVKSYKKGLVSFKKATSFNLDEYVGLPREHEQSYYTYMKENLFNHVDLPAEQIHIPDGNAPDPEAECRQYEEKLAKAKQIDLQILGLGHNGHIGFNEPDHALVSGTHVVKLQEETLRANARYFDSIEEVPKLAITMGVGMILKAKTILLIVRGEDKAKIVHEALTGPIRTELPASLLQTHPNLVVMLDNAASRYFQDQEHI